MKIFSTLLEEKLTCGHYLMEQRKLSWEGERVRFDLSDLENSPGKAGGSRFLATSDVMS